MPKLKKSFRLEGTDVSKSGIGVWDFKTTKAYEYINHFKFVSSQNEETKINFFESLPKTLQAQVSKPSANPEVNQAVFDGDITTHKEYKEIIALEKKSD